MKKISLDLIIVAVASLMLIASIIVSYMAFNKIQPTIISDSKERSTYLANELLLQGNISFYVMPKIQTNIENSTSRLTQAEMTVALEPESGTTIEEIKTYESLITDLIINSVSQSTIDQLDNVSGKIILAEKIKNGTNEIMKSKAIKRVLFSTFSVQLQ